MFTFSMNSVFLASMTTSSYVCPFFHCANAFSRVEWQNILPVVDDISRKLKTLFYAVALVGLSSQCFNVSIKLLYFNSGSILSNGIRVRLGAL